MNLLKHIFGKKMIVLDKDLVDPFPGQIIPTKYIPNWKSVPGGYIVLDTINMDEHIKSLATNRKTK